MAAGLILTLVMGEAAVIFGPEDYGVGVTAYSFDIMLVNAAGELNMAAVRFSTLAAICQALECKAGDILDYDGNGGR